MIKLIYQWMHLAQYYGHSILTISRRCDGNVQVQLRVSQWKILPPISLPFNSSCPFYGNSSPTKIPWGTKRDSIINDDECLNLMQGLNHIWLCITDIHARTDFNNKLWLLSAISGDAFAARDEPTSLTRRSYSPPL